MEPGSAAASKDDLFKAMAELKAEMKGDFARVDAKIDAANADLATRIIRSEARMDRMTDKVMTGLGDFRSELLKAFQDSVIQGKRYADKALSHGDMLNDHGERLKDHERRIRVIESQDRGT